MYATFSVEGRMNEFIRRETASTHFLATLASLRGIRGLSQSRLSQALRGRNLEHDPAQALDGLLRELERLRDAVKPIPVSFRSPQEIDVLLNLITDGQLLVVASRTDNDEKQ